jgi:hypothetical protein
MLTNDIILKRLLVTNELIKKHLVLENDFTMIDLEIILFNLLRNKKRPSFDDLLI